MIRFWVVRHDHNELYLAPVTSLRLWTRNELEAQRYGSEAAALEDIVELFNGRGRAVQVDAPAGS